MSLLIELENPEETSLIISLLNRIKGIRSVEEVNDSYVKEEFGEYLMSISENATEDNSITLEEMKERFNQRKCELYSQKKEKNR